MEVLYLKDEEIVKIWRKKHAFYVMDAMATGMSY